MNRSAPSNRSVRSYVYHHGNMEHPKTVGDRTTLAVMAALHAAGFSLSTPFGENTRYDLVIDDGASLARVQCKTGRLRNGAVRFKACSSYAHHRRSDGSQTRSYAGEVDFFAVHCPETDGVYLIPISELPVTNQGALRVDEPRNAQRRHIRPASRYEVALVAVRPTA
jgi:hypothetical protein